MRLCPAELQLKERELPWPLHCPVQGEPRTNPGHSPWALGWVLCRGASKKPPGWQRNSVSRVQSSAAQPEHLTPTPKFSCDPSCGHPSPSPPRAGTAASRPHPEFHPEPELSCPAPQHSQDLHIHVNIVLVTSSLSLPMRAVLRLLSLCKKQPSNREKPTKQPQHSLQHAAHYDGSSKQIHSLPQSINIGLFSASTSGISCNAIFCVGSRTKGQHPTSTSFLSLQFSEV